MMDKAAQRKFKKKLITGRLKEHDVVVRQALKELKKNLQNENFPRTYTEGDEERILKNIEPIYQETLVDLSVAQEIVRLKKYHSDVTEIIKAMKAFREIVPYGLFSKAFRELAMREIPPLIKELTNKLVIGKVSKSEEARLIRKYKRKALYEGNIIKTKGKIREVKSYFPALLKPLIEKTFPQINSHYLDKADIQNTAYKQEAIRTTTAFLNSLLSISHPPLTAKFVEDTLRN